MLDHVEMVDVATKLRSTIDAVLNQDNIRTRDLGGTASTQEYTAAILRRLS